MRIKYFTILLTIILLSCSKEEVSIVKPPSVDESYKIYAEGIKLMNEGQFFVAAKKFAEAELIMPKFEQSAKASILVSYCYYKINFYDESEQNLETFISKYSADKHIEYAYYLSAIISYEQIVDEKKDLGPLLNTKEKIEFFLEKYSESEYALDLKFKLGLVINQMAAKEMYIARHYINSKKWIPAINRLKNVVENFNQTIFIEEALYRLVEIYYTLGLEEEAQKVAYVLGYNYKSSEWYEKSYAVLNKDYKIKNTKKIEKTKSDSLITRTIKKILK